jgi:hypothetical protein
MILPMMALPRYAHGDGSRHGGLSGPPGSWFVTGASLMIDGGFSA